MKDIICSSCGRHIRKASKSEIAKMKDGSYLYAVECFDCRSVRSDQNVSALYADSGV